MTGIVQQRLERQCRQWYKEPHINGTIVKTTFLLAIRRTVSRLYFIHSFEITDYTLVQFRLYATVLVYLDLRLRSAKSNWIILHLICTSNPQNPYTLLWFPRMVRKRQLDLSLEFTVCEKLLETQTKPPIRRESIFLRITGRYGTTSNEQHLPDVSLVN